MAKLNIVLRTCDTVSLTSDRIVPKDECVLRCLNSLVNSLNNFVGMEYQLYIIDDRSSTETVEKIKSIASVADIRLLPERDESGLNSKQKSRYSLKVAYDLIYSLPEEELVYIVEDDYLHYPDTIARMVEAYYHMVHFMPGFHIGIFPQDFPQLTAHYRNPFNDTYVKPCIIVAGPDRYYRTTWYTHESFMIQVGVIKKFREHFDSLLSIGNDPAIWEGNTISNVWNDSSVRMLMPLKPLVLHVSKPEDLPFYNDDFPTLWEQNKIT